MHQYTLLLDLGDHPTSSTTLGQQRYVGIHGSHLGCIRILDRATSECMFPSLLRSACTPQEINDVPFKVRICTTDKGSANQAIEELIASSRPRSWSRMHLPCCVHIAATIHSKSLVDFQPM